jgi:hypothetical protein
MRTQLLRAQRHATTSSTKRHVFISFHGDHRMLLLAADGLVVTVGAPAVW